MSDNIPSVIDEMISLTDESILPEAAASEELLYKVDPKSKIPISKHYGALWDGRIKAAKAARSNHSDGWEEAIRYYNNNQLQHREGGDGRSGNRHFAKRRNPQWSETENIVYANVQAMMPATYAKNPQCEFTPTGANDAPEGEEDARLPMAKAVEALLNTLANQRNAPGFNLKVHAKQAVISTELTNLAWIEFGYVQREDGSEAALAQLEDISKKLADAQDTKTIRELEGQLMALEQRINMLNPAGPWVKYHPAHAVLVDSNACMPDFSDATWKAVGEYYSTDYLNAVYGEKDKDGSYTSLYKPTHVLTAATGDNADDEIKNFKLFHENSSHKQYGYSNAEQMAAAHRTFCWRIFDKVTRRVYLYASNNMKWPIWVDRDPYGLPNFFPMEPLWFNTTPLGAYAHSSVTYYLDQQDAINEIHDEFRRARHEIKEGLLIDGDFDRDTIEKWLMGTGPRVLSVKVPDGKTMGQAVLEKPNIMLRALPLFDLTRPQQSADRIAGVNDAMRNAQFRTNTTNKAIETYNSSTAQRLDEKIDAIETFLGRIFEGLAYLCVQFMEQDQVAEIIGTSRARGWKKLTPQEFRQQYNCTIVGGSTQKPTSAAKKQQALEIANVLQPFTQFAPSVVLDTITRLFDEAFDELDFPDDVFTRIKEEARQSMERGNSVQGGGNASSNSPSSQPGEGDAVMKVAQLINSLPPQAKNALGDAIARGVPIEQALPELVQALQGASNPSGM